MKRTIAGFALLLMAAVSVNAQQPDQSGKEPHQQQFMHHGQHHDRLATTLNFSDQQKEQLKNINSDYHKKMMDLKNHDEITVKDFKSQLGVLRKDHRAQIQALLTPVQKDQLVKIKEDKLQMAKVKANARAEKMKIKLGLTDAQASQLKTIHTDMVSKIKTIHTDSSLSQEQKHAQIKSLVLQQKDQLKTILTAEQLQQLQQVRAVHQRRDFFKISVLMDD